ncbi:unnamed protein product [Mytilus coruscus]|uniref:WSC domain-containing protein n=1 Tax=Mytilus coruscus TaxID=42192 RepID=A0A6J8E998_MYTCO|nr:unnamed protein product [Mytilus coruscus]
MEDMMLMKQLVILLRLAIAFGSNDTVLQSLVISSQQSHWDISHTSCHYLAETFTAWVDSFLQTSYSITFDGCYEVIRDDSTVRSLIKYKTVADLKECAMSCSYSIEDIGWMDGNCYCIMDGVVTPVSTITALLSPIQCTDENLNRNNSVINLYKRIKRTNLIYKRCPVGTYLGGDRHVFSDIINCEESHKYYCNNSNNVFGSNTWNEAVDNCTSMSGRLINRREVIKKHPGKPVHYWVNGFTVENLAFNSRSNHTDLQSLVISSRQSNWDTSRTSCHYLAGEDVFCSEYNTSQKCRPEVSDFYDTSGLPETFTAWVGSFLQTSYSITLDGCYEILRDDSNGGIFIEHTTVPELKDCIRSCSSFIEYIGWMDGDCYCIMDGIVTPVSTKTALLSPIQCTDEDLNRNSTVFNLYKRTKPLGPATWHAAVASCTSLSGRLINRRELTMKHPTTLAHYWINGFTVENLAFKERKSQDTLCTALTRHEKGTFRFSLLNCSLEYHSVCVQDEKVELETLSKEDWTEEGSTKKASLNTHSTSEIATDERYAKVQSASWKSVTAPSEASEVPNPNTPNTKYNENDLTDDDSFSAGGIAIGITVAIVCIVVVIVCYRRKKQFEEKLKYRKLQAGFKSNKVESDGMLTQNLRYLPSVITYPSGYNVNNLKIPDDVSVEQMEVNATIHKENSILGNPEENVGQSKAPEESVYPEKIQFAKRGSKTEFEPGKNGDENNSDNSGSDDGRYISLVINQDKASDDDDRYISIVSPQFDIDRDNVFLGANIETKGEDIGESGLLKNGLMVADEDEENINGESNEGKYNTDIQTKENGGSYEETDNDRVRADIQEMKDEDDADEGQAKGNHGEVDISKLRALIADENGAPDMTSHILRNFSMNDRIDSAIFK